MINQSDQSLDTPTRKTNVPFAGNILLFYAFDVGDDINLQQLQNQRLVQAYDAPLSSYFKHYHVPLSFNLATLTTDGEDLTMRSDVLASRIHHFGVIALSYKIPFNESLDDLKHKLVQVVYAYDQRSEEDAKKTFKAIMPGIQKPCFYNLKNSYFAVQVAPLKDRLSGEEFKELYGAKIASLLRLETEALSDYQIDDILDSTTGYYGQDLIIIDSEGSFVYDDEYFDAMEFFDSSNVQRLELQCFDRLLDQKLNYFYSHQAYRVPLKAYIPLVGSRGDLPVMSMAKLRVDISVITERLENSIKLAGDAYYEKLYAILVDKLSLTEWKESIHRKLRIMSDVYTVYQDTLDTIRGEMLTLVIIVLIFVEVLVLFTLSQ